MKKLILTLLILLPITTYAFSLSEWWNQTFNSQPIQFGLTSTSYQQNVLPFNDSLWSNGTTSNAWADVVTDRLCLTADTCRTSWPTGGGGSGSVSTSTNEVANQVAVFTSNSATPALVGGDTDFTFSGNKLTVTNSSTTRASFTNAMVDNILFFYGSGLSTTTMLQSGNDFNVTNSIGALNFYGGSPNSVNNGGNITFTSGTGNGSGAGGAITLTGGTGGATGSGGSFTLEAGNAGGGNGEGGGVTLTSGAGAGSGLNGNISLGTIYGEVARIYDSYFGIGTSSPKWLLNLATTTAPQLALQGGATDSIWTQRSIGNSFYLATASPTTFATSTTDSLSIGSDNVVRFGNNLQVPFLSSALTLTGSDGLFAEYAGTSCTNQFVRSLSALGAATCATVGTADVAGLDISADTNLAVSLPIILTDDTLSFQWTYPFPLAATSTPLTFTGLFTATNSSTTLASFGYASSTLWYGGGLTGLACTGAANKVTYASGTFRCEGDETGAGGTVDGSGVANTLAMWTDGNTLQATSSHPLYVGSLFATSSTLFSTLPNITNTYASSTYTSFTTASSTNWLGGGLQTCDPTTGKLTWASGQFGCGTDFNTGGGGSFPFTVYADHVSTSTTIGFFNGLYSTASSTFSSDLFLTSLTQGYAYVGTNGKLNTVASSSAAVGTATALAANGANCASGFFPLGVDASGVSESCSSPFDFSVGTYVSTSTSIGFLQGLFSMSSTTINGAKFTDLAQGVSYIGSNGLLNTTATTTTTCTNQFARTVSAFGVATCATVSASDVSLANLTATDSTLTFSGTYNGSTARTIGLNLGNANSWTVNQTFNYSSSTAYSSFQTASTTLGIFGTLQVPVLTSALTLTGSDGTFAEYAGTSCTNQFVRSLSVLGAATCASINNGDWSGTDLAVANGGTGLSTFGGVNTILYTTAADTLSSEAAFTYNPSTNLLSFDYSTSTTYSSFVTASSTTLLTGNHFMSSGSKIDWANGDVTITHSSNALAFAGVTGDYTFDDSIKPSADDGGALGASGTEWADLFLNTGGVINFEAGNYTITHSSGLLTFSGGITATGGTVTLATLAGALDCGSCTSFEAPNAADPTVDATGEIAINSTTASTSIRFFSGSTEFALYPTFDKPTIHASSTLAYDGSYSASATTTYVIWNPSHTTTLTQVYCKTDVSGSTVWYEVGNGTASSTVQCTTSGAVNTTSVTFTLRQNVYEALGVQSGNPSKITVTPTFRWTAD